MDELRSTLLGFLPLPPQSKTTYSDKELDLTRAYVVLVHAEIEHFCEHVILDKVDKVQKSFGATGKVSRSLRRLIAYNTGKNRKSWHEVIVPSSPIVLAATEAHRQGVRNNQGVKRANLEKLLFPIGIVESDLDTAWLAQMDSFGVNRGGLAHNSIRVLNPPDPGSELKNVNQILQGLLDLDRKMSRLP